MMTYPSKTQRFKLLPFCYNTFTPPSSLTEAIRAAAWDWDSSCIITTQVARDSLRAAPQEPLKTAACLQKLSHLKRLYLML